MSATSDTAGGARSLPSSSTVRMNSKIIITGTGRAGTTFLVRLLTELNLDTGYTRENWQRDFDEHCSAGLEHDPADRVTPRIIKNPALCETLPGLLQSGELSVEHAIIPIRTLADATLSRIRVGGGGRTPGGLRGTNDPAQQQAVLAENFHRLMHTLVAHEIPFTFLEFPRFVTDAKYTRRQLDWLLEGIDEETFQRAFARVARPEMIHDFSRGLPADAGQPAENYAQIRRRKRRRRHAERILVSVLLAAAVWAIAARASSETDAGPVTTDYDSSADATDAE